MAENTYETFESGGGPTIQDKGQYAKNDDGKGQVAPEDQTKDLGLPQVPTK